MIIGNRVVVQDIYSEECCGYEALSYLIGEHGTIIDDLGDDFHSTIFRVRMDDGEEISLHETDLKADYSA